MTPTTKIRFPDAMVLGLMSRSTPMRHFWSALLVLAFPVALLSGGCLDKSDDADDDDWGDEDSGAGDSSVALSCPEGWSEMADGDRCVSVFDRGELTWDASQLACETRGGDLVRLSSSEDSEQVAALVRESLDYMPGDTFFIGLRAIDSWTGPWAWMDGEPEEYSNWITGEPGDGFRAADLKCSMAYTSTPPSKPHILPGMWNDGNCSSFDNLNPDFIPGYACQIYKDDEG